MNALVKKEIRLLLPATGVAVLLALVQAITRPYDFYVACLLFFGLTIVALSSIGRETSLNTFSLLLAQPAERLRIWQTKLAVLAVAFLIVFSVWLVAYGIAFFTSTHINSDDVENSYNLFITVCLIATATFTGGLWATLLVRQLAAAFWLTLLVPAILSGVTAGFLSPAQPDSGVIAGLCIILGIYSIGGFFFARRLFFRAQDVGWTGMVISLPEWKWSAKDTSRRDRKPFVALLKKEIHLQQAFLTAAAGLLVSHVGVILLRTYHHFPRNSAGEVLTSIFWMLWLVLPVGIGCLAIAEERRLGVIEGQLCQPASRRIQFAIKAFVTLFLGALLGGVIPMLLEHLAIRFGRMNPVFAPDARDFAVWSFQLSIVLFAAWLGLVSFFASSLTRNFLQAVGGALVTFIVFATALPALASFGLSFMGSFYLFPRSVLSIIIAGPSVILVLLGLAYLNYKNFRDGWPLYRRQLVGLAGTIVFILVSSNLIYHRAWEFFEPVEPAHGPAKLTLADPPVLFPEIYRNNLLVRLPDGRVWFNYLAEPQNALNLNRLRLAFWQAFINPLPRSAGRQRFISGSNWVSVVAGYIDEEEWHGTTRVTGYRDTVGIQQDGSLWVSDQSNPTNWNGNSLVRFGSETNWREVAGGYSVDSVLLLKKDGTLWRWGTNHLGPGEWPEQWPGLRAFQPYQIGTDSDWKELCFASGYLAKKSDGTAWRIIAGKTDRIVRATNFDQVPLSRLSLANGPFGAYIRPDGALWDLFMGNNGHPDQFQSYAEPCGTETNWVSAATTWSGMLVSLRSDGTLWEWRSAFNHGRQPVRIGIHNDWVAVAGVDGGVVALAADGSLWFWPQRQYYTSSPLLIQLPKQPPYLGNVFGHPD